jgi:hypothetical protein
LSATAFGTRWIPTDNPSPALIALLDASLEAELRELGRAGGAAFRDLPEASWAVNAEPGVNVYATRLTAADAPTRIAELTAALELFGPVTWWAGPSATPPNLADLLLAAGYYLEDGEAGMAVDLDDVVRDLPRPANLVIDDVSASDEGLEAWLEVNRRTLGWSDGKVARRRALYRDDDRQPRPWRHYVGRIDGRPVSASRLLVSGGAAMIHGLSTIAEARRQGIGAALTLAALDGGRALGCTIGVLQASSIGQGPYRRLGFRTIAPYGRYVREPAASPPHATAEQAA